MWRHTGPGGRHLQRADVPEEPRPRVEVCGRVGSGTASRWSDRVAFQGARPAEEGLAEYYVK